MFSARASAKSKRPTNPPPPSFELSAVPRPPLPPRSLFFSPRFSSSPVNPPVASAASARCERDRLGAMQRVKRGRCCQTDLTGKNTLSNPLMSGQIKGEQRPGCCSQGSAKAAVTPEQRRRDCRGRRCPLGNLPGNL